MGAWKVDPDSIAAIQSGVDWVTLTTPAPECPDDTLELGQAIVREEVAQGAKRKEFRWKGYRGQAVEHRAWGLRPDSAYLRVSSCLASTNLTRLLSLGGRPTRVDHQTTITLSKPVTQFGSRTLRSTGRRQSHRGAPVERLRSTSTRGLWIGRLASRSSKLHQRVYDKGVEAKIAPRGIIWRIESELKEEAAEWTWGELREAKEPSVYSQSVCRWLLERFGSSWPLPTSIASISAPVLSVRRHPEVEETLAWLRKQTRGAVVRLWDAGYRIELLEALGLWGLVRPVDPRGDRGTDGDVPERRSTDLAD